MTSVEPIFLITTLIKRFKGLNSLGTATGFFLVSEDKVWLVTNKHVLYGDNYGDKEAKPQVDKLTLLLHTNKSDLSKNEEVEILLTKNNKNLWKEHKNNEVDVVCIPIDLDREKYHFVTISEDLIETKGLKIGFEKIFVMGYPFGWYDHIFNLPITRIGHLSSPFGVPFQGKPFLLGDVETHKGMSGSPVFLHLKDYMTVSEDGSLTTHLGTVKTILLGIYSGQPVWPVVDNITSNTINIPHSLSVVWFATLIQEIISSKEK